MQQWNDVDMRIIPWNSVSFYLPSCHQAWFTQNPKNFFFENKFACLSLSIETKFVYSSIFLCEIDAGGRNGELSGPCPLQSDSDMLSYF